MFTHTRNKVRAVKARILGIPGWIDENKFAIFRTIIEAFVSCFVGAIVYVVLLVLKTPDDLPLVAGGAAAVLLFLLFIRPPLKRRRERLADLRRQKLELMAEQYVDPSGFTREFGRQSGLSHEDLGTVRYDEPQARVTWFVLFLNPGWSPPETGQLGVQSAGSAERGLTRLMDGIGRFVGVLVVVLIVIAIAGTVAAFMGVTVSGLLSLPPLPALFTRWPTWIVIDLMVLAILIWWGRYVGGLMERNRFVITDHSICLFVQQLPWKGAIEAIVPIDTFTQFSVHQSILGRILGFAHVSIKTTEADEQIKARMYCRDLDHLTAVLTRQRTINQEVTRRSRGSQHRHHPENRMG